MKDNKLERAISICKKNIATANEIVTGCGAICKVYLDTKKEKLEQGLLSCSFGHENACLAMCLWKAKDAERYEKAQHFKMYLEDLLVFKSYVEAAIKMPSLPHNSKEI